MYSIFSDGICIHSDMFLEKDSKVLTPKWSMKDNAAGSVSFVLPKQNIHYDEVKRLSSVIQLRRDNEIVWEGRIIEDNIDFWNQRHITCEGALAYLNDTTQPPSRFQNITIYNFLKTLIDRHNARVGPEKRFEMGAVTVHDTNDSIYKYTNNESTWECISSKLIDVFGGHVRVRYQNGKRLIDYLAEYPKTSTQEVQFRSNLLDFTRNFDLSKVATVIMPRGARLEEQQIEGLDAYLDVKSVNGGSPYVTSEDAIKQFGWIEKVVDWDDVTVPANLLKKAQDYLKDVQFEQMVIEANLFDLRLTNPKLDSIDLLDEVRCISHPHGMDRIFPVTSIDIPLDDPGHATYNFGEAYDVTMTGALVKSKRDQKKAESDVYNTIDNTKTEINENLSTKADITYVDEENTKMEALINGEIVIIDTKFEDVNKQIEDISNLISETATQVLNEAKANATEQINMASNGFITITKNQNGTQELYITNTLDYTKATKLWKWNLNGLGYSKNGGQTFGLAMTMDGAIVADFITTGTMSANRIRTGTILSANGNTAWDLDTGTFAMRQGSINLGNKFIVTNDGYMQATAGNIAGFTISPTYISNGSIQVGASGFWMVQGNTAVGGLGFNYYTDYASQKYVDIISNDIYGIGLSVDHTTLLHVIGSKCPSALGSGIKNRVVIGGELSIAGDLIFNLGGPNGMIFNVDKANIITGSVWDETMPFVQITQMNSDGTAAYWYNNCKLHFKQGILMASGSSYSKS